MASCFSSSNQRADPSSGCKPGASEGVLISHKAASLVQRFTELVAALDYSKTAEEQLLP